MHNENPYVLQQLIKSSYAAPHACCSSRIDTCTAMFKPQTAAIRHLYRLPREALMAMYAESSKDSHCPINHVQMLDI